MPQSQVSARTAAEPRHAMPDAADIAQEFRDYAYIVSHDLGAPARLMVEFARLLAEKQGPFADEEERMLLREIVENGEKMRAMMQGLLNYSRLNTMAAPHIMVDTRRVAEHAALLTREKLKARRGTLTIGELPSLGADPDQVMQLFTLLIDNAIRFARPGVPPEIALDARRGQVGWEFSLRDNGCGIDRDEWQAIFKPFHKAGGQGQPGAGMGLALARKITALHGGRIWVDSSSPSGTVITFTLEEGG